MIWYGSPCENRTGGRRSGRAALVSLAPFRGSRLRRSPLTRLSLRSSLAGCDFQGSILAFRCCYSSLRSSRQRSRVAPLPVRATRDSHSARVSRSGCENRTGGRRSGRAALVSLAPFRGSRLRCSPVTRLSLRSSLAGCVFQGSILSAAHRHSRTSQHAPGGAAACGLFVAGGPGARIEPASQPPQG